MLAVITSTESQVFIHLLIVNSVYCKFIQMYTRQEEYIQCFNQILSIHYNLFLVLQSRFCSNLGLPNSVQRAATYIAKRAAELDLCSGRSPISVAAAAIYMASQASAQKKTQKGQFLLVTGFRQVIILSFLMFCSRNFIGVGPVKQLTWFCYLIETFYSSIYIHLFKLS